MAASATAFQPQTHGFKFANKFDPKIKAKLPLIGEVELQNFMTGLCGGMCFTALDYFHSDVSIPSVSTVPRAGSKRHIHLVKKQIESLVPPDGVIKVLNWSAREDEFVWRHTAGWEFRKLITRLDKGQPVVLALIRADRGEDPRKNHQIVAHAYRYDEQSRELQIQIYDPNYPDSRPTITMNRRHPRHGVEAKQSTGEPLRGFFVGDYKPGRPPSLGNR